MHVPFGPGHEATPAGGESGGRRTVRLRGGRAGSVTQERLRAASQSYQPVMEAVIKRQPFGGLHLLCCRIVGRSVQRRLAGSHLFRACDGGDQSRSRIDYARGFSSRRIRRTKVSRTRSSGHGNRAPTRDQPREACRGRRAQRRCGAATRRTSWGHLSGKEGARLVTRADVAGGGAPGAGRRSRCQALSGRPGFSRGPAYLRPRWTPAGAG
jgi:hypothetical protein